MANNRVATAQVNELNRSSQSISQSRKKALKGTVVVQVFKDRLRLCWSYGSKRYFLYIGLPDSKVNRGVAERKAKQIEGDIATGNFDSTGVRKPTKTNRVRSISLTARLQTMLLARQPQNPNPDELVLLSPKGEAIDDRNFRNRAWKIILYHFALNMLQIVESSNLR